MGGPGEGGIGRCGIATVHLEPQITLVLFPDLGSTILDGFPGRSDRGQCCVIDQDHLGGVLRLVGGIGDDKGDAIADAANAVADQDRVGRGRGGRAAKRHWRHVAMDRADPVGGDILAGQDKLDTGGCLGGGRVDGFDIGMRMRRAQYISV